MMGLTYLAVLLVSLGGLAIADRRWRLFLFRDTGAATIVLAAGVAYLLGWDHVGLAAGVFFRGDAPYQTGLELAPDLPLEEAFFLLLLCYSTMILVTAMLTVGVTIATRVGTARPAGGKARRAPGCDAQ